jgi:hypothetical protein
MSISQPTATKTGSGDSLRECGKEAGRTNQRGNVHVRVGSSVKKDGGGREVQQDTKPSLVTGSAAPVTSDMGPRGGSRRSNT